MRFELYVAARYLRAKRRQAVVGVVTAISIAGVAAGVAALIIALAITNGMKRDLQDRLLGASSQVDLMRVEADGIHNWQPLLERLRHLPHVTAAAPGIYGQVLVSRGPRAGFALIKGILPAQERTVSNLLDSITSGSAKDLDPEAEGQSSGPDSGPVLSSVASQAVSLSAASSADQDSLPSAINSPYPPVVLGKDLAETIGAQVGDSVLVTSPQGELTPLGLAPKYQRFRVAAIFHSGFYQYDAAMAFMRLGDAQRLFSEPDLLSVISFKVDDLDRAPAIGRAIERAAGPGYMTTNWMEQNRELFRALKLEQVVTFIVIALIVIVAALNILIALTMMVMEKTRDIAVLMSFGVQPGQVRRIFLLQGLLISLVGTILGLALGYLAAWAGGHYHFIHLSAEVYSIDTLPFAPRPLDGLIVSVVSIGISLLATLYPSSAAARTRPAEALRYE
jgi:lipoprotein-releasing system permease protein